MRLSEPRLWAIVLVVAFVSSVASGSVAELVTAQPSAEQPQPMAGTSARTVIAEVFTAVWCPPCANADPPLSRIADEYPVSDLVMIAYHASGDPYYDATVYNPRASWYGVTGIPTVIIDGGGPTTSDALWQIGAWPDKGQNYGMYRGIIDPETSVLTNIQLSLVGDLTSSEATVTATIRASDPVTETSLYTRFVLYEDPLYYMGTNNEPFHRYVARALYAQPLTIANPGDVVVVTHTFSLSPAWDKNRMGVVAFVQSDAHIKQSGGNYYNGPILQASKIRFVKPTVLYVRDDEVTDYKEYLERPLAMGKRPFEAWNVLDVMDSGTLDIRTPPTRLEMEEYGVVIWSAGSASPALDPSNLNNIGGYLDQHGTLLMTGENVATDLALMDPTWLSNYLHSTHGTDPGPPTPTYVNGVTGDPITGPWASTQLLITGTSPDTVDPVGGASTIMNYAGFVSAAIKSDHAPDSRVVFIGANYFQSADLESRRMSLVSNALNWTDAAAGPRVTLLSMNGGDEFSPGELAPIMWKAIDASIPVDGVDIYYTTSLSSPSWIQAAAGEPNDGVYYWTIPNVQTSDCGVKVVVRDSDFNTPDGVAISAGPCTIGAPDISITKSVSNPTPQVNEEIIYTVTLNNVGLARGYAQVEDRLPSGVAWKSDDGDLTGTSTYYSGNTTVVWTVQVPAMSFVQLHITVTVNLAPAGTTWTNHAFFNSTSKSGGNAQTGHASVDFTIPSLQMWQIDLTVGKHLMSIPLLMVDYRVNVVFATIASSYEYVRAYDNSDPANPWKSYEPGRAVNSLLTVPHGTAFWINIVNPCTLIIMGAKPITTSILLERGWNMVGYGSLQTTYTVADMKAAIGAGTIVEGFDPKAPSYNLWILPPTYTLKAGEGYWVYAPSSAMWTVTG